MGTSPPVNHSQCPFKGVPFIPSELDEAGLDPAEFRILCRIARRGCCYESVPGIAAGCRLDRKTVKRVLHDLRGRGFIRRSDRPGLTSVLEVCPLENWKSTPAQTTPQPEKHPRVCNAPPPSPNDTPPPSPFDTPRRYSPEGTPIKERESVAAAPPARSARMGIPNIEEVRTEASKIGLPPEQADAFRDYHQSAGWRVGRNPMRDWRSALRTWKRRAQDRKHAPNGNAMKLLPGQQLKLWQDRVEAIRSKLTTLPAGGERSALIAEKKQIEAQIQELSKA